MKDLIETLKYTLSAQQVKLQEPMSQHTTFRIGGPADIFVIPQSIEEVKFVCGKAKSAGIPCFILGNGSNLLVSDDGIEGVVIQIYKNLSQVTVEGNQIRAQAGALLSSVAKKALEQSLTGFEFAAGIPGTFGGAITMNAGAYGGEIVQVLKEVTVLTKDLQIVTLDAKELELGYRTSNVLTNGYVVLEGVIELETGDVDEIKKQMEEYAAARRQKQPLEFPSAGSTFKRPEGYFAGKLIQDAGLRGFQVGGARVSDKHCGFVVNQEQATAMDVLELIRQVQEKVKVQTGITLETEVKKVGRFS